MDLGIDGYDDVVEIGRGGFGIVYRARERDLNRLVAIKILVASLDEPTKRRFERERRALGALSGHPNIVTIYASGFTPNDRPYLVMELLPGGSLADRLNDGSVPWPEACDITLKLAAALEVAHEAGVLHRDIKPENVLISSYDDPKLADFGIARVQGMTGTQSGAITASVAHAAPEVLEGAASSRQSDVYSLASTLYALIAGIPAFVRDTDETLVPAYRRIATEPVPDLRPLGVPSDVAVAIERGMVKEPSDRTSSASELAEQLRGASSASAPAGRQATATAEVQPLIDKTEKPLGAPPPPAARSRESRGERQKPAGGDGSQRRSRRRVAVLALVGVLGLLASAGGVVLTRGDSDSGSADAPSSDRRLWVTDISGSGAASVTAEGNTLAVDNFDGDRLYGLSRRTGRELWQYDHEALLTAVVGAEKGVFVFFDDAGLVGGISAGSGKLAWEFQTGAAITEEGFGTYPVSTVGNGAVFVTTGLGGDPARALDVESGEVLWTFGSTDDAFNGGIVRIAPVVHRDSVLVTADRLSRNAAVYSLDADSGEQQWVFEAPDQATPLSIAVSGEVVIVGSRESGVVYGIDASSGEQLWSYDTGFVAPTSPPFLSTTAGMVFVEDGSGTVDALDVDSGEPRWDVTVLTPEDAGGATELLFFSMTGRDEFLYETFDDEDGAVLYVLDANSGDELNAFDLGFGGPWTVADGAVFVTTQAGRVQALDARSGKTLWTAKTDVRAAPVFLQAAASQVFVGTVENRMFAFDAG